MPGNNCGGCGYAGCSGLAAAIVKGEAPVNGCPVGGNPVAAKVGTIMGQEVEEGAKKVAFVKCAGTCEQAAEDYKYTGVEDCNSMFLVPGGGPKSCNYGCMGYGSCVAACPFDAIHIVDGVAERTRCRNGNGVSAFFYRVKREALFCFGGSGVGIIVICQGNRYIDCQFTDIVGFNGI